MAELPEVESFSPGADRRTTFDQNLTYGKPDESGFAPIEQREALTKYKEYMHAAHALIFTRQAKLLWDRYLQRAQISMQARFDGNFGFPGGLLDKQDEESIVDGLNRELQEEINLDLTNIRIIDEDFMMSHINHDKKLVTHFFTKEVSSDVFIDMEKRMLTADEWGVETFGMLRVPLYSMGEDFRGLPVFLCNQFAGNAKNQLLLAIRKHDIIPTEELERLLQIYEQCRNTLGIKKPS